SCVSEFRLSTISFQHSALCLLPYPSQPLLVVPLIKSLTVRNLKTAQFLPFCTGRAQHPRSGSATVPVAPVGVPPTESPSTLRSGATEDGLFRSGGLPRSRQSAIRKK